MGVIVPSPDLLCLVCPGKEDSMQQHPSTSSRIEYYKREATTATSLSCKQGHGLPKQLQGRERLEKNRMAADELREAEKRPSSETPQLN